MMGFMSVASMAHSTVVIMIYCPVLLHGYLTCGKILEQPDNITSVWRVLLITKILFAYGNAHRSELIVMRADLEVYTGFYLIIGWFLGMSQVISIVLYWQCLRVRTMLNDNTKQAFARFDAMITSNLINRLPAVAQKPYFFVRTFLVNMGSPPTGEADMGLASMMATSFRRCTIF
jgi:hypothetical protein